MARLHILATSSATGWLISFGGPGLVLLAVIDHSFVPIPGSLDALTIILAARHPDWWWYYAGMAVAGSLLGGYITYRIGKKGGREALDKRFRRERVEKVYRSFERRGFLAIFVPALLPPPVPLVPFLLAAGALKYPTRKFFSAMFAARGIRYFGVAFLGQMYGKQIIGFFERYDRIVLWTLVGLAVVAIVFGIWYYQRHKAEVKEKIRASRKGGGKKEPKEEAA